MCSGLEAFFSKHLWVRCYLTVSSGNIADKMFQQYFQEQEGETIVDDSRFQIDPFKPLDFIVESNSAVSAVDLLKAELLLGHGVAIEYIGLSVSATVCRIG